MNYLLTQKFSTRAQGIPPSFIREILKVATLPEVISFAGGLPNPNFFPLAEIQASANRVLETKGLQALQYSTTEGDVQLRQWISDFYKSFYDLDISVDEIIITSGSQQGLDLVAKLFLNDGDQVIIEQPSYLGAIQCFSQYMPTYLEVPLAHDGIDIEALENACILNNPKLCYLIPNFQNPTGASYSSEKRKLVCDILRKYDVVLLEDDPYSVIDFNQSHRSPLKKYYPEQTITMGSFSKMIAPGMRLGWITAPRDIIIKLTVIKQASDLHSSILMQLILADYLTHNDLRSHIARISDYYHQQCKWMCACIDRYLPSYISYQLPEGGMFLWLDLNHLDPRQLLDLCIKEGVVFVPGDTFYALDKTASGNKIRLNFSNATKDKIEEGIKKIAKAILHLYKTE